MRHETEKITMFEIFAINLNEFIKYWINHDSDCLNDPGHQQLCYILLYKWTGHFVICALMYSHSFRFKAHQVTVLYRISCQFHQIRNRSVVAFIIKYYPFQVNTSSPSLYFFLLFLKRNVIAIENYFSFFFNSLCTCRFISIKQPVKFARVS